MTPIPGRIVVEYVAYGASGAEARELDLSTDIVRARTQIDGKRMEPGLFAPPIHALAPAQIGTREGLGDDERQLRFWAESCPASFADRAPLVLAEVARLGRAHRARCIEVAQGARFCRVVFLTGHARGFSLVDECKAAA